MPDTGGIHDMSSNMVVQQQNDLMGPELMEKALIGGDLTPLSPAERVLYYNAVCQSLGLNPLTRPFEYTKLDDKTVLYARKDATEQLRSLRRVNCRILERKEEDGVYIVVAEATLPDGRTDTSIGAVPLVKEGGDWKTAQSGKRYFQGDGTYHKLSPADRAVAIMKAETKAKRRVTLSICGLGMLDETEMETIQAYPPPPATISIQEQPPSAIGPDSPLYAALLDEQNRLELPPSRVQAWLERHPQLGVSSFADLTEPQALRVLDMLPKLAAKLAEQAAAEQEPADAGA